MFPFFIRFYKIRWDVAIVWPRLKVIINNSVSVIHQGLPTTKEHQVHSCSALSTQAVRHQQRYQWRLDKKDMPSIATVAMGQHLEVTMIFIFPAHQIPTTAMSTWTTHTSAQQVRIITQFLQEIETFLSMKWKCLVLTSKKRILCGWTEKKWFASTWSHLSFFFL